MVTLTNQERFRTCKGVFDEFTDRTLFTLQSKKIFDELISPLKVGKESNVFVAKKDNKNVIVKIYRMQNADFKGMFAYIKQDPRYEFLRSKRRDIILAWAQREYKNLIKAHRANIEVPQTIGWKNHIIVMEQIGAPAPPLKDQYPAYPYQFLEDIITQMRKLYKIGLVHGDLSPFNILNLNEKPVLIDFSQSTLTRTPNAQELLQRDIKNVLQFFKKLNINTDPQETLKKIQQK